MERITGNRIFRPGPINCDIVRFGIDHIDTVRAISFQSTAPFNGRFELKPDRSSYSLAGLLALLEKQTGVPAAAFLSDHIGGPGCNAASFVFIVNGRLEPLFHCIGRKDIVAFLGPNPREKIHGLFSGKK